MILETRSKDPPPTIGPPPHHARFHGLGDGRAGGRVLSHHLCYRPHPTTPNAPAPSNRLLAMLIHPSAALRGCQKSPWWIFAFYLPAWNQIQGKAGGLLFEAGGNHKRSAPIFSTDVDAVIRIRSEGKSELVPSGQDPGDRRSIIDGELPSDQRSPRSGSKEHAAVNAAVAPP